LRLDGDGVEARVDAGRRVVAGGVGLDGAADVRGEIFDIDGGIGNGGASGIGHLAAEAALRGLRAQTGSGKSCEKHYG